MKKTNLIPIFILFFFSGFAALIYQVAWQRMLFTRLGSNIEAVTIIVSVFMAGLGCGALFGGFLTKLYPARVIIIFGFAEVLTGLYGFFSPRLIALLPHSGILLSAAALFLIPTLLMGTSLPLLTSGISTQLNGAGRTVALLNFVNTLGSAVASLGTVFILFKIAGLNGTIYTAAALNILIGAIVLLRRSRWAA